MIAMTFNPLFNPSAPSPVNNDSDALIHFPAAKSHFSINDIAFIDEDNNSENGDGDCSYR